MNNNQRVVVCSPVVGMLGVAFVVLKLCGVIDWSWWWVTSPFWIAALIWLAAMLFFVGCWLLIERIKRKEKKEIEERRQRGLRQIRP